MFSFFFLYFFFFTKNKIVFFKLTTTTTTDCEFEKLCSVEEMEVPTDSPLENSDSHGVTPPVQDAPKRLYLIRHAESKNNVDIRQAREAWEAVSALRSWPTGEQWLSIAAIAAVPMNTDLSPDGEKMVKALRSILNQHDFLLQKEVQLIVHSPLLRAKRTCHVLFSEIASERGAFFSCCIDSFNSYIYYQESTLLSTNIYLRRIFPNT